jgi:hypothetical protein
MNTMRRINTGHYTLGPYTIRLLEQTATTWQITQDGRVLRHFERLTDARDWCVKQMRAAA